MATTDVLPGFVRDALARGLLRAEIEDVLLRAGWDPEQVKAALAGFADVEFPIPVPRPKPYLSARETFLYVVLFGTLYITTFNLGRLVFAFIDRAFPDPAGPVPASYIRETIRWTISSIIVAFPVFLYVSRLISRTIRVDSRKRGSDIRQNLTYLTLLVAGGVLVGAVITLLYNFLGGELTVRFVLKVLTIGVLAGPIFWYYLSDLRREEKEIEIKG